MNVTCDSKTKIHSRRIDDIQDQDSRIVIGFGFREGDGDGPYAAWKSVFVLMLLLCVVVL